MFKNIDLKYEGDAVQQHSSKIIALLSVGAVLFFLITMLIQHPPYEGGIRPFVENKISVSGVTNPVTAVLLNFRVYDTLLELAVLLIAVIAVLPSVNSNLPTLRILSSQQENLVVFALQRWISPALLVFSGYLLWAGASQPGGAFQAGALLAGGCVLMFQTGSYHLNYTSLFIRIALIIGLMVFVSAALALFITEGNLLQYPENYAGVLILIIESFATFSIAVALAALYSSIISTSNVKSRGR